MRSHAVRGCRTRQFARRRTANIRRAIRRPIARAHIRRIACARVCLRRSCARLRRARRAQGVFLTGPRTIATACLPASRYGIHHAFIVGICPGRNRLAQAVCLRRFRARTRLTHARTCRVATNVIHAETAGALARTDTRRPVDQFWRAIHIAAIVPDGAIAIDETCGLTSCSHTDKGGAVRCASVDTHPRAIAGVGVCLGRSRARKHIPAIRSHRVQLTRRTSAAKSRLFTGILHIGTAFVVRIGPGKHGTTCPAHSARFRARTGLTQRAAGRIAAEVVPAIAIQTFIRITARTADFFVARTIRIARNCRARTGAVVGSFRDGAACAHRPCQIAGAAIGGTCAVATNAVRAEGAHAFGRRNTSRSIGLLARAGPVARIVSVFVAYRIDGRIRIRRNAVDAAHIIRALFAIDRDIACQDRRFYVAHSVAFEDLAIPGNLAHVEVRAIGRKGQTADLIDTRAFPAKIIGRQARAIRRRIATDANSRPATDIRSAAIETRCFRRIRRHTTRANVLRARIIVVRKIAIVIDAHCRRVRHAAADDLFAIPGGLQYGTRERRLTLIGDFAFIVDTAAFLTFRFDDIHAIFRHDAGDARTEARADVRTSGHAERSFGKGRIDRRSPIA